MSSGKRSHILTFCGWIQTRHCVAIYLPARCPLYPALQYISAFTHHFGNEATATAFPFTEHKRVQTNSSGPDERSAVWAWCLPIASWPSAWRSKARSNSSFACVISVNLLESHQVQKTTSYQGKLHSYPYLVMHTLIDADPHRCEYARNEVARLKQV